MSPDPQQIDVADFYDQAPDMFLSVEIATGHLVACNQTFLRRTGFQPEEILNRPVFERYHPACRDRARQTFERFRQTGEVNNVELQLLCRDGRTIEVELNASAVRDAEGRIVRSRAILRDITEPKRAELALRASEEALRGTSELLQRVLDAAPQYISWKDRASRFLGCNASYARLVGVGSPLELLGKSDWDLSWSRAQTEHFIESDRRVMETDLAELHIVEPAAAPDGRTIWLETVKTPLHDAQGRVIGILTSSEDITERRLAELELRKLLRVVEQCPAAVIVADCSGLIEYVNPKFVKLTGYSAGEVKGHTPRLLKSPQTLPEVHRELWATITAGRIWRGELCNRKKNGELFWEHATIAPLLGPDGAITHFVALKEDITERKRLEDQYRQAQKMEAVGQLAGGVAHDFNNILAAQFLHLELLRNRTDLPEEARESVLALETGSRMAADLTRQLLAFSRRQVLQLKRLDLNQLLTELIKLLHRVLGEHIALQFAPADEPTWVHADPGMVEQVVMNLVVNARDAMPDGGRLLIRAETLVIPEDPAPLSAEARPGHFVRLTVSDTGSGMDEATLKHMFEPFFTTKDPSKGTGLGLATVFGIVKQHQGWIEVESRPQAGTTFRVLLPAAAAPDAAPRLPLRDPVPHGSETILLVEDEHQVRNTLATALRRLGYHVLEAPHAVAALPVWAEHQQGIDLLLTDMVMPEGMNGLQLARRLRSERPDLPVILCSGYSQETANLGEASLAEVTFLPKPFELRRLAEVLRLLLKKG